MRVTAHAVELKAYQQKSDKVQKADSVGLEAAAGEQAVKTQKAGTDVYVASGRDGEEKANTYSKGNVALAEQLKAEQSQIQERFLNTVRSTITQQGMAAAQGDGIWKLIAQGSFTADASMKADAQNAISADGYWGVDQTAQRILDFAQALAGTDPEMASVVKEAFLKGYRQAEEAWGGSLPDICGKTYDKVLELFDKWENGTENDTESV